MTEPTLLVADDHPLFRAAVLHVLQGRLPQFRTLEAASAATLGQALQEHPEIELVLLDLSMPGARGFSALLHVRGEYPEVPVVIISSNDHPRVIRRAQQFGAAGFIPKSAPAEAMGDAIQAVLDGGSWFPPMAAERSEADAELAARLAQLTPPAVPRAAVPGRWSAEQADCRRTGPGRKHRQGACHRHPEKTGVLQPYAGGGAGEKPRD